MLTLTTAQLMKLLTQPRRKTLLELMDMGLPPEEIRQFANASPETHLGKAENCNYLLYMAAQGGSLKQLEAVRALTQNATPTTQFMLENAISSGQLEMFDTVYRQYDGKTAQLDSARLVETALQGGNQAILRAVWITFSNRVNRPEKLYDTRHGSPAMRKQLTELLEAAGVLAAEVLATEALAAEVLVKEPENHTTKPSPQPPTGGLYRGLWQ